jgi:hypothetical protein
VRKEFSLDIQGRDWLRNDVVLELWESRPRIKSKKNESDGVVTKEVVLTEEEPKVPVIDTTLRGVMVIILSEWVNKVELTQEDLETHSKIYFFDPKFNKVPEFMYENTFARLKDSDKALLLEWLVQQEEAKKL